MNIIAIDPGPIESAFVIWDGEKIKGKGKLKNSYVISGIANALRPHQEPCTVVIEMIASYGMAVGIEVFETCVWIGRFIEVASQDNRVKRQAVKLHHCHDSKAKDGNIRQALIDRFGSPGTKKKPGTTYGLKADMWQAFALAVYWHDTTHGGQKAA